MADIMLLYTIRDGNRKEFISGSRSNSSSINDSYSTLKDSIYGEEKKWNAIPNVINLKQLLQKFIYTGFLNTTYMQAYRWPIKL